MKHTIHLMCEAIMNRILPLVQPSSLVVAVATAVIQF